jgi:starch-binding outer membrane protein, SusD/RagB family
MKKILFFTITIILSFYSCHEEFLEEEVHDFISPSLLYTDVGGAKAAVAACYRMIARDRDMLGRSSWQVIELTGPALCHRTERNHDAWTLTSGDGHVNNVYSGLYTNIGYMNSTIDNIIAMDELDMEEPAGYNILQRLVGEVQFLRAYQYFHLVALWGDVPLRKNAVLSPSDPDLFLPRASGAEVYDFIIEDLKSAESKLPQVNQYPEKDGGRISKGAVQALLAKVYLQRANSEWTESNDWQSASEYCEKIINAGIHGLAAHQHDLWYFSNPGKNKDYAANNYEVLYAYQRDPSEPHSGFMIDRSFSPQGSNLVDMQWSHYQTEKPFYDTFHPDDTRGHHGSLLLQYETKAGEIVYYDPGNVKDDGFFFTTPGVVKWMDPTYVFPIRHANYIIYRYADVLLMYAEAQNQINNGPNENAYNAVNHIRRRAFQVTDNSYDLPAGLSKQQFIEHLYKERLWELHSELHGLFDVYRFWDVASKTIEEHSLYDLPPEYNRQGKPYWPVAMQDYMKRLPIPQSVLDRNPKLYQNPGW